VGQKVALASRHAEPAGQGLQVAAREIGAEAVVPRLHRRVGGEHAGGRHLAQRLGGLHPLAFHELPGALQQGEGRVPLVQVDHRGLDARDAQGPVPAHAEQDLLLDAGLLVAAVEPGRQGLVVGRVGVVARVEEQQPAAAHVDAPDAQEDVPPRQLDAETQLLAGGLVAPAEIEHRVRRQLGPGDGLVEVLLPAVLVDELVDVALVVEQAHAHHGRPQVAHALQVVARQHAQAAGVDGQRLVEPELGREVAHGPGEDGPRVGHTPALAPLQVALQPPVGLVDAGLHLQVLHPAVDLVGGHALQQGDGVVVDETPGRGIDLPEDGADIGLPGPPEVLGQFSKFLKISVCRFHVSFPDESGTIPWASCHGRSGKTMGISARPLPPYRFLHQHLKKRCIMTENETVSAAPLPGITPGIRVAPRPVSFQPL
jgi:hypothetical protein